jgi:hypothetical protein
MHLPVGFVARLAQGGQQSPAIFVVLENVLALVPAIHDVIDRSRILYAQLASSLRGTSMVLPTIAKCVNSED